MFRNKYQGGVISVFSSSGSAPLMLWGNKIKNGHIKRVSDPELMTLALEIMGVNAATTYITIPRNMKQNLGVRLPFVVIIAKNLKKYFSFEITILDDSNMKRRFMCSNFQSKTKIKTFFTTMPICLTEGWNKIQFNLADLTRRAYGTLYYETLRIEVHANVRLRRIYFCDRLYEEEELPKDYRVERVKRKEKPGRKDEDVKTEVAPIPPAGTPPPESPKEKKGSVAEIPTTRAEQIPEAPKDNTPEIPPEAATTEEPVEVPPDDGAEVEQEAVPAEGDAPAEGEVNEEPPAEEAPEEG